MPRLESEQADNSPYYIFNQSNGQGFAIVAGDDNVDSPILGYSTEGTLTDENMPDALRLALSEYAQVVEYARENDLPLKLGLRKATREGITPFMKYKWDQGMPFSQMTPEASNGKDHCSLGCMAVSVAMIVAHYQYPNMLPGHTNGSNNLRSEAHTYDYSSFKETYTNSPYTNYGEMPQFMYHIANLLDTKYDANGSSATESRFLPTMTDYLGYNKNMKSIMRDSYSAEEWEEIIYNELAAQRPVNFLGSHPDLGGHSYITDGYQANTGFFHMLWGWGTTCEGYFDMNVLNPFIAYFGKWGSMGYTVPPGGFTSGLKAIIGIQPQEIEGNATQLLTTEDITKEGSASVRATIRNWDDRAFHGQFSWAILHDDETFTQLADAPVEQMNASYYAYITKTLNIANLNLDNGNYKIVPICKTSDEGAEWNLCEGYKQKYVEVDVVGGEKAIIPHPVKNVTAEVLTYKGTTGTQYMELLLKLKNHGDDVYGYLTINGTRDDNVKVYGSKIDVAIKAGESQLLSVFLDNGGTSSYDYSGHTYDVTVQYMQQNIGTITVDPGKYSPSSYYITYEGVEFEDYVYENNTANLYNTTLKGNVNIACSSSSGYYAPVTLILKDENKNTVYEKTTVCNFDKKETIGYPIEVTGLQAGKTYYLTAQLIKLERTSSAYSETVVKSFFTDFPINVIVGIPYYTEDGTRKRMVIKDQKVELPANTAAVDFRTFSSVADMVDLSNITNPNCIYTFAAGASVPAELQGKNVVVGSTAEKMVITDNEPLVLPCNFTAKQISYTRTFAKGNNGDDKGWETIVLPFAPTSVTVDGAAISWFSNIADSGRKFWLYNFINSIDGTAYFNLAQQFQANTPYLIAVPGNAWGDYYDLTNKAITFTATNAPIDSQAKAVSRSDYYTLNGSYTEQSFSDGYKLNAEGNFFEHQNYSSVAPFRAYFAKPEQTSASRTLRVRFEDSATGISPVKPSTSQSSAVYNLNGQRVNTATNKGLYIINGKKYIK